MCSGHAFIYDQDVHENSDPMGAVLKKYAGGFMFQKAFFKQKSYPHGRGSEALESTT